MTTKRTTTALLLLAALAIGMPSGAVGQGEEPPPEGENSWTERGWGYGPRGRGAGLRPQGPLGLGGPVPGKGIRMALRHLDLSDSQREEIKMIFEAEREAVYGNHRTRQQLADELREQIETDPYNEEAVRAKAEAVAEIGVEMAVLRARQAGQVREVLTPEQIAKLEELKTEREAFREERRERGERFRQRSRGR